MSQDEAIRLAYTLLAKASQLTGVRVLAIKGVVTDTHGLREKRTPADVDVLICPDGIAAISRQLEVWGWRDRYGGFSDFLGTSHTATFLHDQWPCDIDAHRRFPGLLAPPQQVFDAFWERRQLLSVAGRFLPMIDWASSALILALHSVRSTADDPRHVNELRALIALSPAWTQAERTTLAVLAQQTGCVQSLHQIWPSLAVRADPAAEDVRAEGLAAWRRRLDGRVTAPRVWLHYLRGGGTRQLLSRIGTMLWPPEATMRGSRPIAEGKIPLLRARLVRVAQALWAAPRGLIAIVRGGANVTRDTLDSPTGPRLRHMSRSLVQKCGNS